MVSKFIAMGMLVGLAFADKLKLDQKYAEENFEKAICKDDFKEHTDISKDLKFDELVKTHACCTKKPNLCIIHTKEDGYALTCSATKHEGFQAGFEESKFELYGKEIKAVEKIECKEVDAEHKFDEKFEKALRAMGGTKKDKLSELEKVEGDHINCLVVEEKKEEKKEGEDKKDAKKEDKKEFKVYFFTVKDKTYKPMEKVEEVKILGKTYKGLFCANDETLEKEAKAFAKTEESSCCGWYVWVIVGIVVVAGGVGTWYALKEDDVEEDEFANEYA